jgi:hypothetical protein
MNIKKSLLFTAGILASSTVLAQNWLGTGPIYNNPLTAFVGIGTTTPNSTLTVSTGSSNQGIRTIQTGTTNASISLVNSNTGGGNWALFSGGSATALGAGNFSIYDWTVGADRLFIKKTSGYVGIGTISPQTNFQVKGNSLFSSIATGSPTSAAYIRGNNGFSTALLPDYTWWNNDQTGLFHPANNIIGFTIGGTEAMRIDPNGFVGMGTTTPLFRAHINGDLFVTGTGGGSYGTIGSPGGATMYLGDVDTQPQWGIEYEDPNTTSGSLAGGVNFWRPSGSTGIGGNHVLFLKNDSKVGIHTNNPTADLTVNGNMLIGDPATVCIPNSNYKLFVETGILTEKVKVAIKCTANWSDYVFEENYQLQPLKEVEAYINEHNHLQNIPSAEEVVADGVDLGEMSSKLLGKIEELTLYLIDQNNTLIEQNKKIESLEKEIQQLKKN